MILVAIGSNVAGPWGRPVETLDKAVLMLEKRGLKIVARSSWYITEPYGDVEQPAFVNGMLQVETEKTPEALLDILQEVETAGGRIRREKWGPRTLDLDIIAYNDVVMEEGDNNGRLIIPHPDLHNRSFVLVPLKEINSKWQHPITKLGVETMLVALATDDISDVPKIIVRN